MLYNLADLKKSEKLCISQSLHGVDMSCVETLDEETFLQHALSATHKRKMRPQQSVARKARGSLGLQVHILGSAVKKKGIVAAVIVGENLREQQMDAGM